MYAVSVYCMGDAPLVGQRINRFIGNRTKMLETLGSYMLQDDDVSIDATRFDGESGLIAVRGARKNTLLKIEKI